MDKPMTEAAAERKRLMTEFSIGFDGRRYETCGYRYDRLEDAVDYARLVRTRRRSLGQLPAMTSVCEDRPAVGPDATELGLMAQLGITWVRGSYEYSGFRYEKLADAVNYATRSSLPPSRSA